MTINEKIMDALDKYTTKLKDVVLTYDDVINNRTSTTTNLPLSAEQGKVLQDQITAIQNDTNNIGAITIDVNPGDSVIVNFPMLTRAIAICAMDKTTASSRMVYLDSRQGWVFKATGMYGQYLIDPSNFISLTTDEDSVTFSNNASSSVLHVFLIVLNGSVSIRE